MPEISRFLGIIVRMYFHDHDPPHFHATYGGAEVKIRIQPVGVMDGAMPARALALVIEWATLPRIELLLNWERLRADQAPARIAPLE